MSIVLENVSYTYMPGTPYERRALDNISLKIAKGEFVGIIGHTGSGKSTLVQHLNGLLRPGAGTVTVDGVDLHGKGPEARRQRRKVGMVFQYPEHQLFEETVYEDIAFGPRNLGLPEDAVDRRVRDGMRLVGLDFDAYAGRSPFRLSGGQMRRVAIAGVLALEPDYFVLDEPSAGLDPRGRDEIFRQIVAMYKRTDITVILVSHNMEDIARMATRLIVMSGGQVVLENTPAHIFRHQYEELSAAGVDVPPVTALMRTLCRQGLSVDDGALSVDEAVKSIMACRGGKT